MITLLDQSAVKGTAAGEQAAETEAQWSRFTRLIVSPSGYEPDEDDPAWPSKSGQAD